jgi:predicted MFS family arabinose efflux permease
MLAFAAGMLLVTLWPTYPALIVAMLLAMTGKLIFDPATLACIGDKVHYTRRGLAIAVIELSWSGAFLLGVPVVGWLIARSDRWQAPFPWLGMLAVLGAGMLWRILPPDAPHPSERPSLRQGIRIILSERAALAGLAIGVLINFANEVVSIVFGAWMENSFALEVAALGAASAVIGLAELGGEGLVAGVVDRLGKRRAVALGLGANALAGLLLPALGFSVEGALVGLFFFFITFEFALVSTIPLMTELVPHARATLMAGYVAALSLGRMPGALAGPALFEIGLLANGIVAAVLNLLALAVLLLFVRQE